MTLFFSTLALACFFLSATILFLFSVSQAALALSYAKSKRDSAQVKSPLRWKGDWPKFLVQLPVYNEFFVVAGLLEAVSRLDYPQDRLRIQVLDDSTDETTAVIAAQTVGLAGRGFNIEHIHRHDRNGYKAGALQEGLARDDSEFIAIFDADFIPQPGFIKQVLPYFHDATTGLVQTRWSHANRSESFLTRLMAFGLDAHFSVEQGGRQSVGAFLNFNGTAGVWRREAILDAGGWSADCLTEDLDLSFRAQIKGWKFAYVEDITTPSELPTGMSAIRSQQFRWAKGSAETATKNLALLVRSRSSWSSKFFGTFHLLNSLVYPATLMLGLCLALVVSLDDGTLRPWLDAGSVILAFSFLSMILTYSIASKLGGLPDSPKRLWDILFYTSAFVAMVTGLSFHNGLAVMEGLAGKTSPFVRTPKRLTEANSSAKVRGPFYRNSSSKVSTLVELLLFLLFFWSGFHALHQGFSPVVVTLFFFALSFLMVLVFGLRELTHLPPGKTPATEG